MEFLLQFMANRNITGNVDISQDERSNTIEDNLVSPASQDITEGSNGNTQDDEVDQAEELQYIQRSRGNTVATPDTPNIGAKKRKIYITSTLQNTLEKHTIRSKERDEERKQHDNLTPICPVDAIEDSTNANGILVCTFEENKCIHNIVTTETAILPNNNDQCLISDPNDGESIQVKPESGVFRPNNSRNDRFSNIVDDIEDFISDESNQGLVPYGFNSDSETLPIKSKKRNKRVQDKKST
ncbi:unnamed protein product [Psylliodes chrysocephalus]|uniref:Uncharacterized protein n=1 Tax=Psylliodes chrysocephalus TaxID=3402493 RepID=A0A9P0DAL3_9CUCU|nr:unnamed protein product [Psylliodes chrysocephala]